jgi:hypothetical protein
VCGGAQWEKWQREEVENEENSERVRGRKRKEGVGAGGDVTKLRKLKKGARTLER